MAHDERILELAESFGEPDNLGVMVSDDLVPRAAPVLLVYHDPEDGWWFHSNDDDEELHLSCLGCLLEVHPEVVELRDLPLNWDAGRESEQDAWSRFPRPASWGEWGAEDDAD